jgi:hypothetical protein
MTKMIVECSLESVLKSGAPSPRADFLVLELESFPCEGDLKTEAMHRLPTVLQACRNALTVESIVVTKASAEIGKMDDEFQQAFDLIFDDIQPSQLQSYDVVFQIPRC